MTATHPMKLLTIVCESLAREHLELLLREAGVSGWTAFEVEGLGHHGARTGEMREFGNTQFEVIVQPPLAAELLGRLERDYFPRFAMVAFTTDVEVLRRDKF